MQKMVVDEALFGDFTFHEVCGEGVKILRRRRTAEVENNGAGNIFDYCVFSNRPLRKNEVFSVAIGKIRPYEGHKQVKFGDVFVIILVIIVTLRSC